MPNMPGFEEACELMHEAKLTDHIGMHLVLTYGQPLTDRMGSLARFCDEEKHFRLSECRPVFSLSRVEKEVLAAEIRAQIRRCRGHGVPITHIDSHEHIHTDWAVASVLIPVARAEGVPHVRLVRNCGAGMGPLRRVYKRLLNAKLNRSDLARTKYFGTVEDYLYLQQRLKPATATSFEVMIHPVFDENRMLIDGSYDVSRGIGLREEIERIGCFEDAVSFNGTRYGPR
jgi:predicted glycoside hydrolase/deacetylase ChbG (UPF0249 family)